MGRRVVIEYREAEGLLGCLVHIKFKNGGWVVGTLSFLHKPTSAGWYYLRVGGTVYGSDEALSLRKAGQ